ncbi:MAG: cytochrome c [Acidobacteria bacterium]|nr:cytochrome c [Acidobacteriota bacterium]
MRYFAALTITILMSFVFSGNVAAGADAQSGKAVYDSKCKMCHGADGKGNPVIAKSLKVTLPDLTSQTVQSKTDDELKKQITEGRGKMQPVKGLTDRQIADVIAFVRTLAKS